MIKAVIIDDEPKAIQSLTWELSGFQGVIEVVQTFTEATKALDFLKNNKIDCLFLDIEMPTMDGFQFLEKVVNRNFAVVITTAYNEYAIKALKNEAIDYLLKPIDTDDLRETIEKISKYYDKNSSSDKIEKMLLDFNNKINEKKVIINSDGKLIFLNPSEILFVESDGNYSSIVLQDKKKIVITKKIKEINALLPENIFFRVHNSFVVNLNKIKEYLKTDGYLIIENNYKIPVSRQRKSDFLDKV